MNRTLRASRFASLVIASLVAIGCEGDSQGEATIGKTTVTAAQVPAAKETSECAPLAGTPEDEADEKRACSIDDAPAAAPKEAKATAPRRPVEHAAIAATKPMAGRAGAAAADRRTALNEAIRREVEATAHKDATPLEQVGVLTITSGTVPVATVASVKVPSHVVFASELPGSYRLERVRISVDGSLAYDAGRPGSVVLPDGDHRVAVIAEYRTNESIFATAGSDRVEIRTTKDVTAGEPPEDFVVEAISNGDATTPLAERATALWRTVAAK